MFQTNGFWDQRIVMGRRGVIYPERPARYQARPGNFEPAHGGPIELRRRSRSKRDSSVDTHQSTGPIARMSATEEVPPGQSEEISASDTSSVFTPDLLDIVG